MARQGYQQYCGLARALDVAGDRWTLLIVRELLLGPRRFTDLLDGLPGISRNLLTERLRDLERDGVLVRQELPPPAARQVYELTDDGRDLADALVPLVAWGAKRLGAREPSESFRPQWGATAMLTFANRNAAKGVNETYQYVVGRWAFHFKINDGSIQLYDGQAQDPALTVTTDEDTWADIASGKITGSAAASRRQLKIVGDRKAAARLKEIFARDRVLAQAEATVSSVSQRR
jgi:DNA-binding HxlR family transcriptional regulator/putative sterol carrier protein